VPKRNLGSKRKKEKEKEKETKKRGIEPAIGVPRCANRVPITDRAGPGRAGYGTRPDLGSPFLLRFSPFPVCLRAGVVAASALTNLVNELHRNGRKTKRKRRAQEYTTIRVQKSFRVSHQQQR